MLRRALRRRNAAQSRGRGPSHIDDTALEPRLLWIWGSGRSGSTWLLQLLSYPLKLDLFGTDPDDPLGFRVPPRLTGPLDVLPVNELNFANHLAPSQAEPTQLGDGSYVASTLNAYLGHRPTYLFSEDYGDVWRPAARRLALERLRGQVERAAERHAVADPLVVVKEATGSHAADLVMSLFPRSRLLFLVRDGRDVVDSSLQMYQPGAWGRRQGEAGVVTAAERLDWVGSAARRWVCSMEACQRAHDAHVEPLRRMVRYEDLLADTVGGLAPLAEWAGLSRDGRWVRSAVEGRSFESVPAERKGRLEFHRAATPGLWRESLSSDEQALAHEIMGAKLAELGYET